MICLIIGEKKSRGILPCKGEKRTFLQGDQYKCLFRLWVDSTVKILIIGVGEMVSSNMDEFFHFRNMNVISTDYLYGYNRVAVQNQNDSV